MQRGGVTFGTMHVHRTDFMSLQPHEQLRLFVAEEEKWCLSFCPSSCKDSRGGEQAPGGTQKTIYLDRSGQNHRSVACPELLSLPTSGDPGSHRICS
jgi:hypothetical protein